MKKLIIVIGVFFALATYFYSFSAPGCMDNSRNLKSLYDYKEYHIVECHCPCGQYKLLADRGQCTKCKHFHDVKPTYTIVRQEFYKQAATIKQAVEKRMQNKKNDNPFARTFDAYPLVH